MALPEDDLSPIERAREALYGQRAGRSQGRAPFTAAGAPSVRHTWDDHKPVTAINRGKQHVRFASVFLGLSVAFFLVALGVAGFFLYFGSNAVSADKIAIAIQGPTTIAGGDTVPLSIAITNRNTVAINDASFEIDFPDGTRSIDNVQLAYPRFVEDFGTIQSGETVTRSIKVIIYGAAGQSLSLPVSLSYSIANSNGTFTKKLTYGLTISSTPLSVAVDALSETPSGQPFSIALTVRSNAKSSISGVVLAPTFPFGFIVASSSVPLGDNSSISLGTLEAGESRNVTITGTLTGQNNDERVFHFAVGTAKSDQDPTLAITYMTQDATLRITSPFITTSLAINGNTSSNIILSPGTVQNVSLSYRNALATPVSDASIVVTLSGTAIDYNTVRAGNGFYNSSDHTIVFSKDTDPALASLPPGGSGIGSFSFSTLGPSVSSPSVVFATAISGTRVGQSNVPEQVTSSVVRTARVVTSVALSAFSTRTGSPFTESGAVPPVANQPTTYAIVWRVQDPGSPVAGGVVSATLPTYVTYTGKTSGSGSFTYNSASRTVTWSVGDIPQGGMLQGIFQVSLLPSTSQRGGPVPLTGSALFGGYDRFAGTQVAATAVAATTETRQDVGYVPTNAIVQ